MKNGDYNDLREILLLYEVAEPGSELVEKTKYLMREELKQLSLAHSWQAGWVIILVGLSLILSMGLFYSFTVGTILRFALPSDLGSFLHYSHYVFTAVGGIFLAGVLMVFYLKHFVVPRVEIR